MNARTPPHRKAPVSAALAIPPSHPDANALRDTLSVIDCVHDDGKLSPIDVVETSEVREAGYIDYNRRTGKVLRIAISSRGPHPELTLVHEVGHWLDRELLKSAPGRKAIDGLLAGSGTAKEIQRMSRTGRAREGGQRDLLQSDRKLLREMAKPEELFARFYSQWIAIRSKEPRLLEEIERGNRSHWGVKFFSQEEFDAIVPLFEALFKAASLIP